MKSVSLFALLLTVCAVSVSANEVEAPEIVAVEVAAEVPAEVPAEAVKSVVDAVAEVAVEVAPAE